MSKDTPQIIKFSLESEKSASGEEDNFIPASFEMSPLECMLINMKMPKGFKLLTNDEYLKGEGPGKRRNMKKHRRNVFNAFMEEQEIPVKTQHIPIPRPRKHNLIFDENGNPIQQKKSLRQHKQVVKEDLGYIEKDITKGKSNPLRASANKQCEKCFAQLRKYQLSEFFYYSQNVDVPTLAQIEKNIKNFRYKSLYEYMFDLRKIWNYFFVNFPNANDILTGVSEMSRISEEIYNETEANTMEDNGNEIKEMNKKIENFSRDLKMIKGNQSFVSPTITDTPQIKRNFFERSPSEKGLSMSEIAQLKKNINSLNTDQMGGLIAILSDTFDCKNQKFLEFDVESLEPRKLKEISKYVKSCIRKERKNNSLKKFNSNFTDQSLNERKNEMKDTFNFNKPSPFENKELRLNSHTNRPLILEQPKSFSGNPKFVPPKITNTLSEGNIPRMNVENNESISSSESESSSLSDY